MNNRDTTLEKHLLPHISSALQSVGLVANPLNKASSLADLEILEELHRGLNNIVYCAEHKQTNRVVVLKIATTVMCECKLEQEVSKLTQLRHPNIASVQESGHSLGGQCFVIEEFVEGSSLFEYVSRNRLTIEQRLQLFEQICLAVHHANDAGSIHGDLKPTNIMVTESGQTKIINFGQIAHRTATQGVNASKITYRHTYLAPELHIPERHRTISTEVYALGVLLFELLTGHTRLTHQQQPSLLEYDPTIAADLDIVINNAVATEPYNRYSCVAQLAKDIRKVLNEEPVKLLNGYSKPSSHLLSSSTTRLAICAALSLTLVAAWSTARLFHKPAIYLRQPVQTERSETFLESVLIERSSTTGQRIYPIYEFNDRTATLPNLPPAVSIGQSRKIPRAANYSRTRNIPEQRTQAAHHLR